MKFYLFIPMILLLSCENLEKVPFIPTDLSPPPIISFDVIDKSTIAIVSNESIFFKSESYFSRESLDIKNIETLDESLIISFENEMIPGFEYCSEFRIEDENGNSLSFISNYYGYNPRLPTIIINEFIVKGTKTNPDKIELYVVDGGNMAGMTIFNGSKNNYDYSFVFPSIDVNKGEYLVVRATSDKFNKTFIETDNLSINNDSKFIEGVRDLRVDNLKFSSTNGTIALYSDPYGSLLDCVVYTKNSNDESKNYRNFGLSATMNRIDEVTAEGGWAGLYDLIFPDDSIYSANSTTTRSLNRINHTDTGTKSDWKTVATGEATFGFTNSLEYY